MRVYFSESNLAKAAGLSAVVTVMSTGRLAEGFRELGFMIVTTFLLSLFICGAVTAWGSRAGMAGIVTDRRTMLHGIGIAALIASAALTIHFVWLQPLLHRAILSAHNDRLVELSYPSSTAGCFASVLWSAGFQVMFLQAAPMSLCARLSGRRDIALALSVASGAFIATKQVGMHGITENGALFVLSAVVTNAAGCFIFARYGLVPMMFLGAGLGAHVFFPNH